MSAGRNYSTLLLGVCWLVVGAAKIAVGDHDAARLLMRYLPEATALLGARVLVGLEVGVGVALLIPWLRLRRAGLLVSLLLLLLYGGYVLLEAPASCTCVGRLGPLPPALHTALTAVMLFLVASPCVPKWASRRVETSGVPWLQGECSASLSRSGLL